MPRGHVTYNGPFPEDSARPMKNTYRFYRERRSALLRSMREHSGGGLALVPTAPEVARNRDSLFPYRPDSYFYYLSGFPEPEAVIALLAGPDGGQGGLLEVAVRRLGDDEDVGHGDLARP